MGARSKISENLAANKMSERWKVTCRSELGVLSFVCVVIQTNEVEPGLHLITAAAEHVISAGALTGHLITPGGGTQRKVSKHVVDT